MSLEFNPFQAVNTQKKSLPQFSAKTMPLTGVSKNQLSQQTSDVFFSGQSKPKMTVGKKLATLLATAAGVVAFSAPGVAAAQGADEAPVEPARQETASGCDEFDVNIQNGTVNNFDQLPAQVNEGQYQRVFLTEDSMLSQEACEKIAEQFNNLYTENKGDFVFMEIENTDLTGDNLNDLANEVFDVMALGDEVRNDGLLVFAVQERFENNEEDRFLIVPGNGIDNEQFWGDEENAWFDNLDPVLNEFSGLISRGDTEAAKALISDAFTGYASDVSEGRSDYVDGLIQAEQDRMEAEEEYRKQKEAEAQAKAERDAERRDNMMKALPFVLVGLVAAGGGTVFAVKRKNKNQWLDSNINTISESLSQLDPHYELTRKNVHTIQTLGEVIDPFSEQAKFVDASLIIKGMDTVLANLSDEEKDVARFTLEEKGLKHPQAAVRIAAVERLVASGEADYDALMQMLMLEDDPAVIQAMHEPIVRMTNKSDATIFDIYLESSTNEAVQILALDVIAKHADQSTLQKLFEFMEKPLIQPAVLDKVNQVLTALMENNPSEDFAPALLEQMKSDNPQVQSFALTGLTSMKKPVHFADIYQAFLENKLPNQDAQFKQALQATVSVANSEKLTTDLLAKDTRVQKMNLALLSAIQDPAAVPVILDYLKNPDTPSPDEAIQAFVACVDNSHQSMLEELLMSDAPETEESDLVMAVVQALQKLGNTDVDLKAFITVLDNNLSPNTLDALQNALNWASADQGINDLPALMSAMESSSETVRLSAIRTLAKSFGSKSLAPLFNHLDSTFSASQTEKELVKKNILDVVAADPRKTAYDELLTRLNGSDEVSAVAAQGLSIVMDSWLVNYGYDDAAIQKKLAQLATSKNPQVAGKAKDTREGMVDKKIKEIDALGESGDFGLSSNDYTSVAKYETSESNPKIQQAAKSARHRMEIRRKEYEVRQAKLAAERAKLEAERARQRERERQRRIERERNSPSVIVINDGYNTRRTNRRSTGNSGGWGGSSSPSRSSSSRRSSSSSSRRSSSSSRRGGSRSSSSRSSSSRRGGSRSKGGTRRR